MNHKDYDIRRRLERVDFLLNATLGGTNHPTDHGATAYLDEMRQVVTDQVILQVLEMPTVHTRFDSVATQKEGTFEWIFTEPDIVFEKEPHLTTTFPDWLKSGDGIFHICGKPGAGKSTLMKFLCRHPTTNVLLNHWSGKHELLFAKFFFWKMGADEQKSIGGLIRSLLYQILCKEPQLARQIFSKRTRERMVDGLRRRPSAILEPDEIMAGFSRLVQVSTLSRRDRDAPGIRVCLFIDGLDEFDDSNINHSRRDLVDELQKWATNSNGQVKICVSSRIEEPFMEMLDRDKRFSLHNLTKKDIEIYIHSTLRAHPAFLKHQERSPQECQVLISSLERYTQGIFLWVALMLKELESCLDDGCSVELLQGIVHKIPQDWNEFLEDILCRVNKHFRKGVEALLAALVRATGILMSHHDHYSKNYILFDTVDRPLPLHVWGAFMILQASDKGILMLADVAMDRFGFEKEVWFNLEMGDAQVMDTIGGIIERRCKGLVQVTRPDSNSDSFPFGIVEFTHRSIPEYLEYYLSRRPGSGLDKDRQATVTLSWATLKYLEFKPISQSFPRAQPLPLQTRRQRQITYCSTTATLLTLVRQLRIDDTWEDIFRIFVSIGALGPLMRMRICTNIYDSAACGLHEFIDWLFRKTDLLADDSTQIFMMDWVIDQFKDFPIHIYNVPRTMEILLTHNGGLVQESSTGLKFGLPLWYTLVERILEPIRADNTQYKVLLGSLLKVWLKHGANPRVRICLLAGKSITISSLPDNPGRGVLHNCSLAQTAKSLIQYLELEGKWDEDTGARWVSLRDYVRCSDLPNKSEILECFEDDTEEGHDGTRETPLQTSTSENENGDAVVHVQPNEEENSWLMSLPWWEVLTNCR
jgi:hypothetical protein